MKSDGPIGGVVPCQNVLLNSSLLKQFALLKLLPYLNLYLFFQSSISVIQTLVLMGVAAVKWLEGLGLLVSASPATEEQDVTVS